jgi:large subunit ribosomal protein L4
VIVADEKLTETAAKAHEEPKATSDAKPAAAKPAAKKPAAKKPAVAKPAAKKPAPAKPAAKKPAPARPAAAKPRAVKAPAKAPEAKPVKDVKIAKGATPSATSPSDEPKAPRKAPSPKTEREVVRRAPDARTAVVVDAKGKKVDELSLAVDRFGLRPSVELLHLAVRAEQAARRRGTASSKSRGEIAGSTAKLYRQKGTGRARVGSCKSPTRIGGGVAFGPRPRSFDIKINRKAAAKALDMALSDRAESGSIVVARDFGLTEPSTAVMNDLLVGLDVPVPVLVVTKDEPVVTKSVRNLWYAEPIELSGLTVEQVLRARTLVVTEKAFAVLAGARS